MLDTMIIMFATGILCSLGHEIMALSSPVDMTLKDGIRPGNFIDHCYKKTISCNGGSMDEILAK